jgi:hypothetical protein
MCPIRRHAILDLWCCGPMSDALVVRHSTANKAIAHAPKLSPRQALSATQEHVALWHSVVLALCQNDKVPKRQ